MKNYLGECSSMVTRPNGEHSEILVSNPAVGVHLGSASPFMGMLDKFAVYSLVSD